MSPADWRRIVVATLIVLGVIAAVLVPLYFYGRAQCPPPGWWFSLFDGAGVHLFACVA